MIRIGVCVAVVLLVAGVAGAAEPVLPPGDPLPVLRLETGGPRSSVSGLAFSADGRRLYAGGWDKAVQTWDRTADGHFQYSSQATLRVPAGGGLYGGLNALALSDDGQWLATAGEGYVRDLRANATRGGSSRPASSAARRNSMKA